VAKNTIVLYIQMAITVVMSLYTTRLVLSALGASDFGVFNVVGGAITMLTFLNSAMTAASQRFMSFAQGLGNVNRQKEIFNVSLKMHLIIAFLMILILEVFGLFLFDGILNIAQESLGVARCIYQFLIVSIFFTIISVPYDAVINAHENMLFFAILRIIEVFFKFLIALYLTSISSDKLYYYGLFMAVVPVILFLIRQIYIHKKYEEVEIDFKKYKQKSLYKEMFDFAGWSFLGSSSTMIANYGQGIVVNMFFGTTVNAAQGISVQVSGQLGAFANTMLKALNPLLAKSEGAGDRAMLQKASLIGCKLSFFLLVVFYVPVIIEMSFIFELWLGKVPEFAIVFCRLLLIRNLIEQLFITLNSSIAAVGDIKQFQKVSSVLNFIPLLVSYLFFIYGAEPQIMYIIFIIYAIIKGWVILYYAKIKCGFSINYFLKEVFVRCFFVFIITYSIAYIPKCFINENFYRFLTVSSLGLLSFFGTLFIVGLDKYERKLIKKMIISILNRDR